MVTSSFSSCEDYQSNLLMSRPSKRKVPDYEVMYSECRPKRVSPFLNTPKQRRDERRKVLRMSVAKLKAIDDPETFLRRSVLINNTVRRLNREMKEEKRFGYGICGPAAKALRKEEKSDTSFSPAKRRVPCDYDVINNSYLPYSPGVPDGQDLKEDKITDDMSDALAKTVSDLGSDSEEPMSVESEVPTPVPSNSSSSSTPTRLPLSTCAQEEASKNLHHTGSSSSNSDCSNDMLSERDRQILGEMDYMFNQLINVLSEVVATC